MPIRIFPMVKRDSQLAIDAEYLGISALTP